jgi:hypothetical protein
VVAVKRLSALQFPASEREAVQHPPGRARRRVRVREHVQGGARGRRRGGRQAPQRAAVPRQRT